jgi:hypothetical protein
LPLHLGEIASYRAVRTGVAFIGSAAVFHASSKIEPISGMTRVPSAARFLATSSATADHGPEGRGENGLSWLTFPRAPGYPDAPAFG